MITQEALSKLIGKELIDHYNDVTGTITRMEIETGAVSFYNESDFEFDMLPNFVVEDLIIDANWAMDYGYGPHLLITVNNWRGWDDHDKALECEMKAKQKLDRIVYDEKRRREIQDSLAKSNKIDPIKTEELKLDLKWQVIDHHEIPGKVMFETDSYTEAEEYKFKVDLKYPRDRHEIKIL